MKLIIVGSARCVWDDLLDLSPVECDVMCINDMIMYYPGDIHHICSLDEPMLIKWWEARRPPYKKQFPLVPRMHTRREMVESPKNVECWPFSGGGTSGLFACFVGLGLGYDEITLCGIPIDNSGHFWEAPWGKTNFQRELVTRNGAMKRRGDSRSFWANAAADHFDGRVKSMSGVTRDLLGAPEKVVFHDNQQRI